VIDKSPLVSVGIPTYNRPEGLRKTLQCIIAQSYRNLEILVSDNCSTNCDVERVVKEFIKKDKRIYFYRHAQNLGPSFNFKFVLEKANGNYFMWAADDDSWEKEYVEKNLYNLLKNENAILSVSRVSLNGKSNNDSLSIGTSEIKGHDKIIRFKQYLTYPSPSYNSRFYGLIKTEYLKKCVPDKNFFASDWAIMLNLLKFGDFIEYNENLMSRNTFGISSSHKILVNYYSLNKIKRYLPFMDFTIYVLKEHGFYTLLHIFSLLFKWNKYFFKLSYNEFKNGRFKLP